MTELERYKEAIALMREHARVMSSAWGANPQIRNMVAGVDAILNPPPEMEEVEETGWKCVTCGDMSAEKFDICINAHSTIIKLTGTYQRPKPQKVERSVELWFDKGGEYQVRGVMDFSFHGKRGTFTYSE